MKGLFLSAAVFTFAWGSGAFALENCSGGGDWNSNKGQSGTFTENLTVDKQANGDTKVQEEVTVKGQTMKFNFTIRPTDTMRFKVIVGDATVGHGYCWNLGDVSDPSTMDKVCHYQVNGPAGKKVENTVHITHESVHQVGSVWDDKTKTHIAWMGTLTAVTPEE